jgi:hypothetical protein
MTSAPDDRLARVRWGVYLVLIAVAVGNMSGRLLAVNSVDKAQLESYRIRERLNDERDRLSAEGLAGDELNERLAATDERLQEALRLQRPFLSANDRSRWMNIRSLVEHGTYEIDEILNEPTWDSIDKVQHVGRDGRPHFYSSKPPLLATLIAGEYWLIHRLTGWTLGDHPYEIGRFMLFTTNVLPLVLMWVLLARLVERFGMTDWGRIFVMGAATLGTFLNTFAVVLNNHIVAAVSVTVALYMLVRILYDGERRWQYFALAGFAASFTAASELPALILLAIVSLMLLWRAPRETLVAFAPAVVIVAAGFFATNWIAHQDLRPPYAHREWYDYEGSYWRNRQGVDKGEPSKVVYALHALVGHHGVLSLTPVWLLSIWGAGAWLMSGERSRRELAALVVLVSVVCLVFYLGLRTQVDRNDGGVSSGFRWMFWCAPLWLLVMLPAADKLSRSAAGMALAAVLLTLSVLSASYPTWNPWVHPWIYNWLNWIGWPVL